MSDASYYAMEVVAWLFVGLAGFGVAISACAWAVYWWVGRQERRISR